MDVNLSAVDKLPLILLPSWLWKGPIITVMKNDLWVIERFSIECRKTKTKVITLANHKGHR